MIRFAILSYPGAKSESETVRAFRRNGMEAEEVIWGEPTLLEGDRKDDFDGYCIVGKLSEDNGDRVAAIAARDPVMERIREEAARGKVVMGIGFGARVLVESGMIPGYDNGDVACALVWQGMPEEGKGAESGTRNRGVHLKNIAPQNRSAFNSFTDLLALPYGHGEGQFVFGDPATIKALRENGQLLFEYCDEKGKVKAVARNVTGGSAESIAALCNPAGNVMAIVSHPGRDPLGGGDAIFRSIHEWIESGRKGIPTAIGKHQTHEDIRTFDSVDLEFLVRQRSSDNAELAMEGALRRGGFGVSLTRYSYWSVKLFMGMDPKAMALRILQSGSLADQDSERVMVRMGKKVYRCPKEGGLKPAEMNPEHWLVVRNRVDLVGVRKAEEVRKWVREIDSIGFGILWDVEKADDQALYGIVRTKILYNPNSMYILKN